MTNGPLLLAGLPLSVGMEHHAEHVRRVGALPGDGPALVDALLRSDLRGRGGAAFPAAVKWRAVADRARGNAVVVANGAEGEPLSRKDRVLMETRPHLVLDGAATAAQSVGATSVVLYIGTEHTSALDAMRRAVAERPAAEQRRTSVVTAPVRYVSGEETAAVHQINDGVALPVSVPPRPFERGVNGRPTLVHNVETLAHAALIARHGDAWFRDLGIGTASGSALVTVNGAVAHSGVIELAQGTSIAETVNAAGGLVGESEAVLLGGYFGGWVSAGDAWGLRLDAAALKNEGYSLGCGVVAVLPGDRCGVVETARIVNYLAGESAQQCGPCVFGLRAIAEALQRIAAGSAGAGELERLRRWTGELPGRGACRHPDGAAGLVASALRVFDHEFARHVQHRSCSAARVRVA